MTPVTRPVILFLSLLLLFACAYSTPSRYYTLTSSIGRTGPAPVIAAGETVAIGPVTIPDYLNRAQIVTRQAGGQVRVAEFDRWAGSLEDDVSRVLVEDMSAELRPLGMAAMSWRQAAGSINIPIQITRFDALPGERVRLAAQWSIRGGQEGPETPIHETAIDVPVTGSGYQSIVTAMSAALGQLAEQMAQSIIENQRTPPSPAPPK